MNTELPDNEPVKPTPQEKRAVKEQNWKSMFGSGAGRIVMVAASIIMIVVAALSVRSLMKTDVIEVSSSQVDAPTVAEATGNIAAVTEEEALRRQEANLRDAEAASNRGDSFQPSFDINIIEAPAQIDQSLLTGFNSEPPAPVTPPADPAADAAAAQLAEQQRREREREQASAAQRTEQELRSANEARERYIQGVRDRAMAQAEGLVGGGAMNNFGSYTAIMYPQPKPAEPNNDGAQSSNNPSTPEIDNRPLIFKAGSTIFATLDAEINTDDGSDVFATVRGGAWDGSRLLGKVEKTQNNIRALFTILAPQDDRPTMPINAIALRAEDAKQGIATSVNHHTLSRYGSLGFASLLSGYGKSFEQTPGTTIVNPAGTTVQTIEEPDTRQIVGRGLGEMGTAFAEEIKKGFDRPPTFSTPADTGFAIFFLTDVKAP